MLNSRAGARVGQVSTDDVKAKALNFFFSFVYEWYDEK